MFRNEYSGWKMKCLHAKTMFTRDCANYVKLPTWITLRSKKRKRKKEKKPTFSFTSMGHQIYKTRFRNFMNCNYLDRAGVEFVKMQIWNPVKYRHGYSWWKIQRRDSLFEFSYGKWLEFTRVKLSIFYRAFVSFFSRVFITAFVAVIENNYTIFRIKTNITDEINYY